jgi:hypothetical protein
MEMEEMEWFEMMGDEMELVEKELGMIGGEVYFVDEVKGVFGLLKKRVEECGDGGGWGDNIVNEVYWRFGLLSGSEYEELVDGRGWLLSGELGV